MYSKFWTGSFDIFVDGLAQIVDGLLVAFAGGINDAVLQMILKNHLAGIVNGGAHSGDLNKYIRAVAPVLNHASDRLQMADGAGKAVEDGLGVFVGMAVPVIVGSSYGLDELVALADGLLLSGGVDVKTVSERLGHADVATTLRIYAHVMPGRDAHAAEAFEAAAGAFGSVPKACQGPCGG